MNHAVVYAATEMTECFEARYSKGKTPLVEGEDGHLDEEPVDG